MARGLPCPFSKIRKSAPIFGKNALIVIIYGLDLSFKMQFLRVPGEKTGDSPFINDCLSKCVDSKKTLLP